MKILFTFPFQFISNLYLLIRSISPFLTNRQWVAYFTSDYSENISYQISCQPLNSTHNPKTPFVVCFQISWPRFFFILKPKSYYALQVQHHGIIGMFLFALLSLGLCLFNPLPFSFLTFVILPVLSILLLLYILLQALHQTLMHLEITLSQAQTFAREDEYKLLTQEASSTAPSIPRARF